GITMTFTDTGYVNHVAGLEHLRRRNHLAELDFIVAPASKLACGDSWSNVSFAEMSTLGRRRTRMLLPTPGNLHCIIAVDAAGFDLAHCAWPQLDHRYRTDAACGINRLSHANLFTNQSTEHFFHQSGLRCRSLAPCRLCRASGYEVAAERARCGLCRFTA